MFQDIAAALGQGEAAALATVVKTNGAAPCDPGTKLLVRADGSFGGTLGGAQINARVRDAAVELITSGDAPTLRTFHLDADSGESVGSCGATLEIFLEPLRPEPRLLIAGTGYVAQALARLAVPLGWRVALVDDRSEFAQTTHLPDGAELVVGEIAPFLAARAPDPMSAVVIVTRGHRSDHEALQAALATNAGYVGMIGSPSKVRNIFTALTKADVSAETLARVHAPIGLDLGGQTPDEIALSIAAELVAWRRGGSTQPLHTRHQLLTTEPAKATVES